MFRYYFLGFDYLIFLDKFWSCCFCNFDDVGQEAKCVFVGWVTSDFHRAENPFSLEQIRRAEMRVLDVSGQLKDHCFFQNAYLVCAGDLQEQAANQGGQEKGRGSATPGVVVGTTIDIATGLLTFSFNGQEIEERYQIEPGTKLFPAVFVEPTGRDVIQFEFSGTRTALPLTSALFHRVNFFFKFSDPNQLISSSKFYQLFYGKMDTKRSCDICMNVRWVRSFEWPMDRLIDWLVYGWIDRLIDWLIDWLIGWLMRWLFDWRVVVGVIGRLSQRLIDWLIDWLTTFLWNLQDRILTSQCPPRLRVLTLHPNHWSRVPSQALRVHELKMSDVRGWSMLCDDPVSILAVHIPEEDRCIDILELIENEDLLQYVTLSRVKCKILDSCSKVFEQIFQFSSRFHAHTLTLYCAISSHSNYRVAHALVKHVDQKQLLFALQNPCKLFCMLNSTLYSISIPFFRFLFSLRIHQNPLKQFGHGRKKFEKKNRKKNLEKKFGKKFENFFF